MGYYNSALGVTQTSYVLAESLQAALHEANQILDSDAEQPLIIEASLCHTAEGKLTLPSGGAIPEVCKQTRSQRRAKRRQLLAKTNAGVQKAVGKRVVQRRLQGMLESGSMTQNIMSVQDFKSSEGGWMGSRKPTEDFAKEYALEDLRGSGLKLVEWDGISPHALLDNAGHVVTVLVGRARGTFEQVLQQATSEFQQHSDTLASVGCLPSTKMAAGQRGCFHSVTAGFSYGGGQRVPMNTAVPARYRNAAQALLASNAMSRLAGFQNQAFKAYFSGIHGYYDSMLSKLYAERGDLCRPYQSSIMPAAAFNLGPATVCHPHRDSANLSFGICSITALGSFCPKKGGHLVLRELGLIVEFPPGATVLIPSAILTHYNTKIQQNETRYSFTQYAAGALFCYIDNGMKSEQKVISEKGKAAVKLEHTEARRLRWEKGLAMFPHISGYKGPL